MCSTLSVEPTNADFWDIWDHIWGQVAWVPPPRLSLPTLGNIIDLSPFFVRLLFDRLFF